MGSYLCLGVPEARNLIDGGRSAFELLLLMVFDAILDRSRTSETSMSCEIGIKNHVFS